MTQNPGTYTLGPGDGALTVRTGKAGPAAKAGHNLLIDVTAWSGELTIDDDGSPSAVALSADPRSLRVREGTGGVQALGEDDKDGIRRTIDDEVLKGEAIAFRSTSVSGDGSRARVEGELELRGKRRPLSFELALGVDGTLTGSARLSQTDWGMKPYSTLFGTLKVADEVEVAIEARLPAG